jgi:PAS domain S-box-containing protein
MPAVLYSPLPIILWSAIHFGEKGASGAILVVTVVLLWLSLNSSSVFITGPRETNVFALQIFLISLSTPLLLLGASIDEARDAVWTTRESEQRMSFAAASANVGLWHLEPATARLWATDHCRSMLGIAPSAPLTRTTIMEAIHPDDRQATVESIRSAAYSGEEASADFRVVLPDGHVRWFRARARSDRDKQGKPFRVSGIFVDITARKEAAHEAELQRRELAHLMRVSVVGQLSGAIAHELNQPLASILSNAEAVQIMLQDRVPNLAEMGQAVADIVSADERASEIIDRLRRLLRKDEGKLGPIDFKDLVASTLRLLHSEIISRRIKVTTNLAEDLPPAWGDGVQLQQVLLNLIMNAMDALASAPPARRIITVSTRRLNHDQIETAVSDLGHGLSPQAQGRVFEPFFTTKPHGLGLGLSICSTLINLHGGTLQLTNNAEGGARASFTVRIFDMPRTAGACDASSSSTTSL